MCVFSFNINNYICFKLPFIYYSQHYVIMMLHCICVFSVLTVQPFVKCGAGASDSPDTYVVCCDRSILNVSRDTKTQIWACTNGINTGIFTFWYASTACWICSILLISHFASTRIWRRTFTIYTSIHTGRFTHIAGST